MRLFIALMLAVALAGCATKSSVDDGQKLETGEGFIALHIDSNIAGNLWYIEYSSTNNFMARLGDAYRQTTGVHVYNGQRYWLLNRPAGEYMWHQFNTGTATASLRASNRFRVKPGVITYVGHLQVHVAGNHLSLRARDGEADMRRHLESTYPAILRAHPFEKDLAEVGLSPQ